MGVTQAHIWPYMAKLLLDLSFEFLTFASTKNPVTRLCLKLEKVYGFEHFVTVA